MIEINSLAAVKKEEIVQAVLDYFHGKTYLEIGMSAGNSFWPIRARRKWGVDPNPKIRFERMLKRFFANCRKFQEEKIFKMTSGDFFLRTSGRLKKYGLDVALIDGLHTYSQSLKDVLNCLAYLNKGGVILMHDCNPTSEAMAYSASCQDAARPKLPEGDDRWCGDVWKSIVHLRSTRNDLVVFVLDCDYGVGVIARGRPETQLNDSVKQIERMTYFDLNSRRQELLNLKEPKFLQSFLRP